MFFFSGVIGEGFTETKLQAVLGSAAFAFLVANTQLIDRKE